MNNMDTRRLDHAAQTLKKGRAALTSDPKMGLYWIKSALWLQATTLTKLESVQAPDAIRELAVEAEYLHTKLEVPIAPTEKNDLVILSLSIGNVALAQKISNLRSTDDEYPFTRILASLLAMALGTSAETPQIVPQITSAEKLLIDDLASITEGKPTNLSGTEKFWSMTRNKRYANTIHEHSNFFKAALASLQCS